MKKLLVAAMGIAAAYGAFADPYVRAERFDGFQVGAKPKVSAAAGDLSTTYWSEGSDASKTNEYEIVAAGSISQPATQPDYYANQTSPDNALSVKTQFGKPLSFNVAENAAATSIGDGLYFDSLVKFTVCDDPPTQEYSGAKIVMWLQATEDESVTNIMINAGYLTKVAGDINVSNATYTCKVFSGDVEAWHRVTIKAIPDITKEKVGVPAFVVFIDGVAVNIAGSENVLGDNFYSLNENAEHWYASQTLFPSLVQGSTGSDTLTNVGFDGTGKLTDLVFTDKAPSFAEDYSDPKIYVKIGAYEESYNSFEEALTYVNNNLGEEQTAELSLLKGMTLDAPLEFSAEAGTIILDFAGFVLTNETVGAAAITNSAAELVITNSTGKGGIYCETGAVAIYNTTTLDISTGNFWGPIAIDAEATATFINGGAFQQNGIAGAMLAEGKVFASTPNADGLYEIIEYVAPNYTIDFVYGDPATHHETVVTEGAAIVVPSGETIAVVGKDFLGWSPETPTETAVSNATYTAIYADKTFKVIFVDGDSASTNVVNYGSGVGVVPAFKGRTGYTAAWDSDPTAVASVTSDLTFTAVYTGKTFTIVTYTNGVVNTSKKFTYAGVSVDPEDPTFNSETETWDGKFYTENGGSTEFAFDAAGELTQNAYATIETKGGSSDWDPVPSEIPDSKTAAQEYPALDGTPLATANAKKLTIWATANSVTLSDAKSATTPLVESYLLNCAPADLEAEKAAFKLNISFDGSGNPVVTLPDGKAYNVTPTMKGSNDLSTWKEIDSTTGYQFFKYELSL